MIRRGATPQHTFTLPFDNSFVKSLRIIYTQNNEKVIVKDKADCTFNGKTVSVRLTQRETLRLKVGEVEIQIRLLTTAGDSIPSLVEKDRVVDSLSEEVLV